MYTLFKRLRVICTPGRNSTARAQLTGSPAPGGRVSDPEHLPGNVRRGGVFYCHLVNVTIPIKRIITGIKA